MNEVIRQLYERKSVRVFEDREIEEPIVQQILRAATMAPTAGNQQMYTILRITDPALRERLAESCDHQPFIARGKLVLVFCADCLKWYEAFRDAGCAPRRPGPGDLMLAVDDALIAAQNAVVAAQAHGIGSCYIGDIMENIEVQRELLGLPELVFPAVLLVFGYPTRQQQERPKPERVDLDCVVHENRYRRMDGAALRRMFRGKAAGGDYEAWMAAFCQRKYNSDFAREMSRSVGEYLKQYVAPEGEQGSGSVL
ncbi:MAG: nitroreductase family protein [Clostridia bacterium]|nr:nitroreductase family protein [Clostridia bacterium]